MCKSVPQMEAARTRTSTSFGPIVGTGTFSRAAPRSGRGFLSACIVAVVILFCAGSLRRARNSSTAANAPAILVAERERASGRRWIRERLDIQGRDRKELVHILPR